MAHCHLNVASPSQLLHLQKCVSWAVIYWELFWQVDVKTAHVAMFYFVWPGLFGCGFAPALHIWKVSSEHWKMLFHCESEPELAQIAQGACGITIPGIIKNLLAMVLSNWLQMSLLEQGGGTSDLWRCLPTSTT